MDGTDTVTADVPFAPFTSLAPTYRVPYSPLTCDAAMQHAAQDNTQIHLARLLPDLRALVDRLLRDPEWYSATRLTPLPMPEITASGDLAITPELMISDAGERVVMASMLMRAQEGELHTTVHRCLGVYVCAVCV